MDKRVRLPLHQRLIAALAAALPPDQLGHPDARALLDANAHPPVDESVLMPLADALGLTPIEQAAAALALWSELDPALSSALSLLQGSASRVGASRPTLGLLANLAARIDDVDSPAPARAIAELLQGSALSSGLLQLADASQLVHARALQMPTGLVALLAGDATSRGVTTLLPPLGEGWDGGVGGQGDTIADAPTPTLPQWGREPYTRRGTAESAHREMRSRVTTNPNTSTAPGTATGPVATAAFIATTALGRLSLAPLAEARWPIPTAWAQACERLAQEASTAATPSAIVLRGADTDELRAVAARVALQLGRTAFEIISNDDGPPHSPDALAQLAAREGIVPALIATRGLPAWRAEAAPGSAIRIPTLAHWSGPLIVLAANDTAFDTSLPLHEFELGLPDAHDRLMLWCALRETTVDALAADDRAAITRSRCGISVLAQAAANARSEPAHAAIEQAVRASARSLSAWAQVSNDRIPADAWVGPPDVHRELGLLLTRCLARADAGAQLGPLLRGRLSHGVKALFIGASGTGKTLAAQWLADRLVRPLVRVDLAAVVSKYIGETEKNLAHLLSRAEHLDAVLLFDEADSLFGARTDVKQANDRYANMQTNYLLQRLETFHGVAVLTSNSKARFDDAFLRRLDSVVQFPLPDVAERRILWNLHLGDAPSVNASVMSAIAALVDLPGGHIRNAVLTAVLLARQRADDASGDATLCADDLREALALEYRKLGQRAPDSL
jgi:hypothetical protein